MWLLFPLLGCRMCHILLMLASRQFPARLLCQRVKVFTYCWMRPCFLRYLRQFHCQISTFSFMSCPVYAMVIRLFPTSFLSFFRLLLQPVLAGDRLSLRFPECSRSHLLSKRDFDLNDFGLHFCSNLCLSLLAHVLYEFLHPFQHFCLYLLTFICGCVH